MPTSDGGLGIDEHLAQNFDTGGSSIENTDTTSPEPDSDNREPDGDTDAGSTRGRQDDGGIDDPLATKKQTEGARDTQQRQTRRPDARADGKQQEQARRGRSNAGDLIDIKTGRVVAPHGTDHKAYFAKNPNADTITRGKYERILRAAVAPITEQVRGVITERDRLNEENKTLKAQLETATSANQIGTKYGLTPTQVDVAGKIVQLYLKDPQAAITYLVHEAKKNGYTVKIDGQGTDIAALDARLEERLRPLTEERKQKADEERRTAEARAEWERFVAGRPDAAVHQGVLAELMARDPTMTLAHATLVAERYFETHGYDWSRPLSEQLNDGVGGEMEEPVRRQPVNRPMPSGRRVAGNGHTDPNPVRYASPSDEWSTITRDTMRAAGFKL